MATVFARNDDEKEMEWNKIGRVIDKSSTQIKIHQDYLCFKVRMRNVYISSGVQC